MSFWAHIDGLIQVSVPGRTQPEIQYIISSVLDHLPRVTGSEGDMDVHFFPHEGFNSYCSCDEYGMNTNNLVDTYGYKSSCGSLRTQHDYTIVVEANLRDRFLDQSKKEFMKWLIRLGKRLYVQDVLVRISGWDNLSLRNDLINIPDGMYSIHEHPSWGMKMHKYDPDEIWWGEHLMWNRSPLYDLPIEHVVKYTDDEVVASEFKRRKKWEDEMENEYR